MYLGVILGLGLCIAIEGTYDLVIIGFALLFAMSSLLFGILSKFIPIEIFYRIIEKQDS